MLQRSACAGRARRAPLTAFATALALLAGPGVSGAFGWTIGVGPGNAVVVTAAAGETNNLRVAQVGSTVSFTDPIGPPSAVTHMSCNPTGVCTGAGTAFTAITINLGDGNDQTTFSGVDLPVTQNGEAGDDTLRGPTNSIASSGGPGTDRLEAATASSGSSTLDGGTGPDTFVGGPGSDTVTYAGRTAAVTVSLDGAANDGELAEGDNVGAAIDDVVGGSGNDTLTGADGFNILDGRDGNDTIDAGAGNDVLLGGAGDDTLRARDGFADRVECGPGTDTAVVDTLDVVGGCETVDRADVGSATDDRPPDVAITAPRNGQLIPATGVDVNATATDDRGVARVVLIDDGRVVGTDTAAPYTFRYQPTADDVGRNTLIVAAFDTTGQTGTAITTVRVARFGPRGLTSRVTPSRDRTAPYRFRTQGLLQLPVGVTPVQSCGAGTVSVQVKRSRTTISSRRVVLKRDCSYSSTVTFNERRRLGRSGRLRFTARFLGNEVLGTRTAPTRTARAG